MSSGTGIAVSLSGGPGVRSALAAALLASLLGAASADAQPVEVPPTWGGDLASRPRLTGAWGGVRDDLGEHGVVFDADVLLTPQSVFSGGRDSDTGLWGDVEYTLNLDTQKLGLWPGGFVRVSGLTSFGDNMLRESGALGPVNTSALLPAPDDQDTALMNATIMQFLSPKFGVVAGKVYTLDGFEGEFSGNYRTQFMNTALTIPLALALVPISAFGGGLVALPTEKLTLSLMALDAQGTPESNSLNDAFDEGVMLVAGAKLAIEPFGRVGHQSLGGTWSSETRLSLDQDPANIARLLLRERFPRLANPGPVLTDILVRFLPGLLVPVESLDRDESSWTIYYAFDQYLWQPDADDPKRGLGIFFSFGVADEDVNPIQYAFTVGLGGNGIVPGRPHDTFGLGWAHTEFSDKLVPVLRTRLDLGLDHEDAVEAYYNVAVTPWLGVTLDLQVVRPGLEKKRSGGGTLNDLDTAVVGGIRAYIRF